MTLRTYWEDMRPQPNRTEEELYECLECGERAQSKESGTCEGCGGELLHLGRSRDL